MNAAGSVLPQWLSAVSTRSPKDAAASAPSSQYSAPRPSRRATSA